MVLNDHPISCSCDAPRLISDFFSRSSDKYEVTKEIELPPKIRKLEKKRQSGINKDWNNEFPWLEDLDNGMACGICRKHQHQPKKTVPGKAVRVDVPCCSITLQAVKRHKASDSHKEAEAFERELAISSSQIEQGIEKEVTINSLAMEKAMRCLYWLCKEELPHTTKFSSLLDLCKNLGVNELNALKQSRNASYTSERFVQEVLVTFHSFIMTEQIQEAQKSPYYTLLVDETTDVFIKKELIIYIKYLNQQCESEIYFSQITSLKDRKARP